jgi:hypothetical protein
MPLARNSGSHAKDAHGEFVSFSSLNDLTGKNTQGCNRRYALGESRPDAVRVEKGISPLAHGLS